MLKGASTPEHFQDEHRSRADFLWAWPGDRQSVARAQHGSRSCFRGLNLLTLPSTHKFIAANNLMWAYMLNLNTYAQVWTRHIIIVCVFTLLNNNTSLLFYIRCVYIFNFEFQSRIFSCKFVWQIVYKFKFWTIIFN